MGNLKLSPILCLILVLSLVVMEFPKAASSDVIAIVYIYNNMIAPVQVICRNTDRPTVTVIETLLLRNENVSTVFQPSVWGTTRFNCDFKYISAGWVNSFDVWYDKFILSIWIKPPCRQCAWVVDSRGFTEHKYGEQGPAINQREWIPEP